MPPRARRGLASVPPPPPPVPERPPVPDLRDAVRLSIAQMGWLKPSDDAMKALALRTAAEIEEAIERAAEFEALMSHPELRGDTSAYKRLQALEAACNATKTVGWLGQQLQGYLRDLGGTPAARAAMKADKPVGSRLAQLRESAKSTSKNNPQAGGAAPAAAGEDDS